MGDLPETTGGFEMDYYYMTVAELRNMRDILRDRADEINAVINDRFEAAQEFNAKQNDPAEG